MSTTVVNPGAAGTRSEVEPQHSRAVRQRPLLLAASLLTLVLVVAGTQLFGGRSAEGATAQRDSARASSWTPFASPWLERLDVTHLEAQLVRAGYSLKVDGNLDPITKSALADYLRLDSAHPLTPSLASELEGTVITGFRNPAAWNSHHGLNRKTKFVERPLTGPGGQLDANGNYRPPGVVVPAPRKAAASPRQQRVRVALGNPLERKRR